jgi:hypothetical protein
VPTSGTAALAALSADELADPATYYYAVTTRDGVLQPSALQPHAAAAPVLGSLSAAPSPLAQARLEVR